MQSIYDKIKEEIDCGRIQEAIEMIDGALAAESGAEAALHYLRGNAFMKRGDWKEAMACYLQAEELDPDGPAREAKQMLTDILNFYNKDLYNP